MTDAPATPRYAAFADAVLTIGCGAGMADELASRFPDITRFEVFLGIAIAWAIRDADLIAADCEIRQLRAQIAATTTKRAA